MSPIESNIKAFRQSFVWSGRTPRSEFWWFFAGIFVLQLILLLVAMAFISSAWMLQIVFYSFLLLVLPALAAAAARRLHDVGWSAWWQFLPMFFQLPVPLALILIPPPDSPLYSAYSDFVQAASASTVIGSLLTLALFVLLVLPSQNADNEYGPRPSL